MAVFAAENARMVAIEIKQRAVNLYVQLAPILSIVNAWTLNGTDAMLPMPFDIKVEIESYRKLRLDRLRLEDEIEKFLKAKVGDSLIYGNAPEGIDLLVYNDNLIFNGALTW